METQNNNAHTEGKENIQNAGIPGRQREGDDENLDAGQESLPSDGPVSQSEGTIAPDLNNSLERDDPAELREDSNPG